LLASGGRRGDGLSAQSVKNVLRFLGRALADAERDGIIARNPMRAVKVPKTERRPTMRTWSAEEASRFDDATADHELGIAFHLALTCGLRRGEVLGLRWSDVDLDRGVLSVRAARVAAGYAVAEGPPKSGKARTIALGATTVARLREHRRRQLAAHLAAGLPRAEYVVTRADGSLPHPMSLSYFFDEAIAEVGVPRIRFHDLRHTHATLLLEAGVHPKIVQERLGHSSIAITLDVYSHVTTSMQAAAAATLDAAIYGGGS
jgi:integrase